MELDEDHSLRNNGKPLIFQGEFSNTLFKSSRLSKVNTIRSSSRSLVVRDFKNFQARELLFLMITLDIEIRELTFPTRVREGRRKAETTTKKREEERLKQSFRRGALRERVERERSF
jgi:hypothetical protein